MVTALQGGMFSAGESKQPASVSGNSFEASPGVTFIRHETTVVTHAFNPPSSSPSQV